MTLQTDLKEVLNILPDKNKLAVVVAKRARQLSNGAHPLVDVKRGNDNYMEIAIKEILENKIWYKEFSLGDSDSDFDDLMGMASPEEQEAEAEKTE